MALPLASNAICGLWAECPAISSVSITNILLFKSITITLKSQIHGQCFSNFKQEETEFLFEIYTVKLKLYLTVPILLCML